MKISYNWLKEYVNHTLSPEELSSVLTMAGLEEEESIQIGNSYDGVVVGYVLSRIQHPNADKLSLCKVNIGTSEPLQIVCGAPNVDGGQYVPVALVGTTLQLPSRENPAVRKPFTLRKSKIRGEYSEGMICSEMELEFSENHEGIMVLEDASAFVGQPFSTYLQAKNQAQSDVVIDVAITPNRPDAISHLGVARDISALQNVPVQLPEVQLAQHGGEASTLFKVTIECPETCRRYVGVLVKNVTIKPSPDWMKQRLEAIGLRPRNNIVDITNYVMHECGQPLHAFDFDQLAGKHIIVKELEAPSQFITLDDKARLLPKGTIMICDAERPVAIGGIMGGQNSEVTEETTNVLIESAWFNPTSIRKAAKNIREVITETRGLSTDASYRFERGVDTDNQVWAAMRAATLMVDLANGTLVDGLIDCHPNPAPKRAVTLRPQRANALIGATLPVSEMKRMLSAIGFEVSEKENLLHCIIPSFRPDIEREVDVIEEVARLYGYDNIPVPQQSVMPNIAPEIPADNLLRAKILNFAKGLGFREIYTNSMLPQALAIQFHETTENPPVVKTINAVSKEMEVLRPSLLPGVLKVVQHNQNHGQDALRLVEFGHIFERTSNQYTLVPGYHETEQLVLAISGYSTNAHWQHTPKPFSIYDLKGITQALLEQLNLTYLQWEIISEADAHFRYKILIRSGKQILGTLGEVNSSIQKQYALRFPLFVALFDWDGLAKLALRRSKTTYNPISKYPVVTRDLAIVIDKSVPAQALVSTIEKVGGKLLQKVSIFDHYEGDKISPNQKSLAFSLQLGADRTLVDKEIDHLIKRVILALENQFQATLRQ